jgi:hypothetical protein
MNNRRERRPVSAQSRDSRIIDGTEKDGTPMFLSRDEVIALCDQKTAVQKIDQATKLIDELYTEDATGMVFVHELWIRLTTVMLITQHDDRFMMMVNAVLGHQVGKRLASTELVNIH